MKPLHTRFLNLANYIGLTLLVLGVGFDYQWAWNAAQVYYWSIATAAIIAILIMLGVVLSALAYAADPKPSNSKTAPPWIKWAQTAIVLVLLIQGGLIALPTMILCTTAVGLFVVQLADQLARDGDAEQAP